MPVRHTFECDNGHEFEQRVALAELDSVECPQCDAHSEILWRAKKGDYQIKYGFVDRL